MAHAQSSGQLVKSDNRRIAPTLFQTADVLLAEPRNFGELFLRQTPPSPNSHHISADQLAHIHASWSTYYKL